MQAVRFNQYGGISVLQVVDVPVPEPGKGEILVGIKAASINPGEAKIREGMFAKIWPATFPSGEGSDLAGVVVKLGPGVTGLKVGDEVIGYTDRRASHAEYALVEAKNVTTKPTNLSWEVAGSLAIAGSTAYAAVRAVSLKPGDKVAVSGAAGGVGSIAAQLAKHAGAEVIGIAGNANHAWLSAHGIKPVTYRDGLADHLKQEKLDAFIDTHGEGYVKLAVDLGIAPQRIDTIVDFAAAKEYGAKAKGAAEVQSPAVLAKLAALAASGQLDVPIAATYPLREVREAFTQLEKGHTQGKIVLVP